MIFTIQFTTDSAQAIFDIIISSLLLLPFSMLSTKRLELIKHRDSAMVFLGYSHIATIMLGDFYT